MNDPPSLASNANAIAQIKGSAITDKLVAVIGTGVSIALTGGKRPELSWKGLITNGFEYGTTKGRINDTQKELWRHQLNSEDIDDILGAAEFMGRKLDAPNGDLYARWLENVFQEVNPANNEMAKAICALQTARVPICTLNYDPLLERVTGLPGITFGETTKVTSWMRRESQAILHLHGSWDAPATCILGIRDYETTVSDEIRDLIQRNLSSFSRLLFIGCGDTFVDPNFSALIKWLRARMKTAAPQHYALVSDAEEIRRHADPSWHGFVDPVSYGATHNDLPAFLLKHFQPAETPEEHPTSIPLPATDLDLAFRCIDDHEPKPQIFGRDDEVETIINALLEGKTTLVAGGPGMGKTAVATAAMYDPRIVAHYGRRRVFASLETAIEPRAILAKLVEAIGLPPTGDEVSLLRILEANAAEKPFAAVLDNVETVFDANRSTAERLLTLVSRIPGLSATITIRGVAPPIPGTIQIDNLSKLDPDAARSAFLAVAGGLFRDDPDLPHILDALDGHALSVRLVAARAIGSPSLEGLRESWDEAHAELLRISGEEEGRLTSVRASLALSLNSNRMKSTPLARRLMSLLAFLPGGLVDSDVRSLLGERGVVTKLRANEAVVCLHQLRLIESRPDGRLRMLTPLRESVRSDIPPFDVDQRRIIDRYLILAAKGFRIGLRGWETHSADVEAEADNLDSVCELAVTTNITHRDLREALRGLTKFHIFSGRGDIVSVERAAARLHLRPPTPLAATCVQCLGEIALAHSDHEAARACFEDALALHRKTRNKLGEANCIKGLGSIAEARSDQETARARTEEALVLHRSIGNVLGEANCIRSLGGIAKARSDHETARKRYEEAIALYRSIGDILGEANSLRSLGDIAETHYDHEVANAFFEQAMTLYQSIASVLGEANCIQSLAHIRKSRSDYETACAYFEQAIKIYRHIGEKFGEANCIRSLGEIASSRSDFEKAVACLEEALAINRRVGDALGEAHCIHGFGEVALMRLDLDAARAYFEEAKALYMHIGDKLGEANSIQGLGDISWLQSDHESAKLHYIEARELYRRIDDFGGDARSLVKLGHLQRIMFIAAEGLANIEAGFALYFKIADSKDRALPGWQAMYQSLTCDDVSVAQKHRQLARSLWTAIGRLDLVFDWTERA